jgi:glycosyltransferase 2 family protein
LRAGEIVRGVLVSRWLRRKFREVLPSMAVERLLDALWFSAVMALIALLVPIPRQVRTISFSLLIAALVGMGLFIWNAGRTNHVEAPRDLVGRSTAGKIMVVLQDVTLGLKQIGFSRPFWGAAAFSGLLHLVQALAFLAVLEACRIDLPLVASIAVFLIVQLGIAIPNAPANVGTFQLFCVLGLTFFGVDKSAAAAVSVLAFAILTFPVLLIGALATVQAGLSLTGFRSQIRELTASAAAPESAT